MRPTLPLAAVGTALIVTVVGCAGAPAADGAAPSRLQVEDVTVGSGARAERRKCVYAHYTAWMTDGRLVETSRDAGDGTPGAPVAFALGTSDVIAAWNEGIAGMQAGGIRRLTVPHQLAYGARGRPPAIPPRTDLVFEVELLAVANPLPGTPGGLAGTTATRSPECPTWDAVRPR